MSTLRIIQEVPLHPALCNCRKCLLDRDERIHGIPAHLAMMVVCRVCGDKRCPHAEDHTNACTTPVPQPPVPPPGCDRGTMINQNLPTAFCNIGHRVDSSLPPGTLEVWQDGKRIGRIENIGQR